MEWLGNGSQGLRTMLDSFTIRVTRPSKKEKGKGSSVKQEEDSGDDGVLVVNGESVEREMDKERRLHRARAGVIGLAFTMGVVGIWGDGA